MIGFIKKLFNGGSDGFNFQPEPTGGEEDLANFVKFVVCNLVDKPKVVDIKAESTERALNIKIFCEKEDIGKIIGKNGKTIEAIRSLVNGAAGRLGKRANVEVAD